jgi:hypothetical protein
MAAFRPFAAVTGRQDRAKCGHPPGASTPDIVDIAQADALPLTDP